MKKIFLASTFAACTVALISCKKDYVCECNGVGTSFTYDTVYTNVKKKDAELKCNSMDFVFFGYGQECDLK